MCVCFCVCWGVLGCNEGVSAKLFAMYLYVPLPLFSAASRVCSPRRITDSLRWSTMMMTTRVFCHFMAWPDQLRISATDTFGYYAEVREFKILATQRRDAILLEVSEVPM